jgi:hypothetical protein
MYFVIIIVNAEGIMYIARAVSRHARAEKADKPSLVPMSG